jgi:hypothetical protein
VRASRAEAREAERIAVHTRDAYRLGVRMARLNSVIAPAMELAVQGFRQQGKATEHDVAVSMALANVVSGGKTDITETITEKKLMELERENFMALIKTGATLDRIEHMLTTGKPLRN